MGELEFVGFFVGVLAWIFVTLPRSGLLRRPLTIGLMVESSSLVFSSDTSSFLPASSAAFFVGGLLDSGLLVLLLVLYLFP